MFSVLIFYGYFKIDFAKRKKSYKVELSAEVKRIIMCIILIFEFTVQGRRVKYDSQRVPNLLNSLVCVIPLWMITVQNMPKYDPWTLVTKSKKRWTEETPSNSHGSFSAFFLLFLVPFRSTQSSPFPSFWRDFSLFSSRALTLVSRYSLAFSQEIYSISLTFSLKLVVGSRLLSWMVYW